MRSLRDQTAVLYVRSAQNLQEESKLTYRLTSSMGKAALNSIPVPESSGIVVVIDVATPAVPVCRV